MVTDQLNRLLDMFKKKLASLEKVLGVLYEIVQKQQEIIRKMENAIQLLSTGSQRLLEEEIEHYYSKENIEQLSNNLERVTECEHVQEDIDSAIQEEQKKSKLSELAKVGFPQDLAPLQELIIKLQQKITEVNLRQQKETQSGGMEQIP